MRISTLLTLFMALATLSWAQTNYLVETSGLTFSPNALTIEVGDTVTWQNTGGGNHNVNGGTDIYPDNPEGFSSGAPSSLNWTYQHVFTLPGTYAYQCDPHVAFNMVGTVTVNDNTSGGAGDIVITEISYNPPESGTDTYEFVELYNNGNQAVNLLDYTFSSGFEYTFTSGVSLAAGEYLIMAVDGTAFEAAFGIPAITWTSGGLSNGGEAITLRDAAGMVVDSVDYSDGGIWPAAADGDGATLVLCDFDADNNDGSNWAAANTPSGVFSNGIEIFANPGASSNCTMGATVAFLDTSVELNEDAGTATLQVAFNDLVDQEYSIDIMVDPSSTATLDMDVSFSPASLVFTASGEMMRVLDVTVTVTDDTEMESLENLVLTLVNPSSGLSVDPFGETATITILDNDTDVPDLVISEIMYNPPGTDTEGEYLEIYNRGGSTVNMGGFYFEQGIEYVFPDVDLPAGEYLAITVDSLTFQDRFGFAAWQWTSGALGNGGETLELRDASGNTVDEVTYDDEGEWPTGADGSGPALVLCDVNADNSLAASWSDGVQATGVFVSGNEILGSPGAANDCTPPMPPSYPPYAIGLVTTNNEQGIPDSLNRRAELTGIVYGVNLRPGGLLFTMIGDDNEGIAVFSNSDDYDYTVTEGDEVRVQGVISQFQGLTQLNADTLIFNSANNQLVEPTMTTVLDESTESQLIELMGVMVAEYVTAGNGLNVTVVDGEDNEYLMRVDFNTNITEDFIATLGDSPLLVRGIGGQFDSSAPFDEGYQISPRYTDDIQFIDYTGEPLWGADLQLYPLPLRTELRVKSPVAIETLKLYNLNGQLQVQREVEASQFTLDVSKLPGGTYLLELQYQGERIVRPLLKQ